jgi:hypothetical protein
MGIKCCRHMKLGLLQKRFDKSQADPRAGTSDKNSSLFHPIKLMQLGQQLTNILLPSA